MKLLIIKKKLLKKKYRFIKILRKTKAPHPQLQENYIYNYKQKYVNCL